MMMNQSNHQYAVCMADLNGDRISEIAAVFRSNGQLYVDIIVWRGNAWVTASRQQGQGYGVTLLAVAPIANPQVNNLVIGWQIGAIWSKLSVYAWTSQGMQDLAPAELTYSYAEIVIVPSAAAPGGEPLLALWSHDTGEAYQIELSRWRDGVFVPARDAYMAYFPKVVENYVNLVNQHPNYPFYWSYLADAQLKAGMPSEAYVSVQHALSFEEPYPSREALLHLKSRIEKQLYSTSRAYALYPAAVKTTQGTMWGYIDSNGRMIIQPQYEYAYEFQPVGLAVVQQGGHSGLIYESGAYAVHPIYDSIGPFSEGRAAVIDKDGFKLIDESGYVITHQAYSYMSTMHDGRALVYNTLADGSSKYGYIDRQGKEVIPLQYEEATDFNQRRAVVKVKNMEYALIQLDGKKLAIYPYAFVGQLGDGLLPFQKETDGKYGYLNEQGAIIIAPAYTNAFAFQEERAVVNTAEDFNSAYGVIDKRGKWIIQPAYNEIRQLGQQRLAVGKAIDESQPFLGSIFAIYDTKGSRLSDFKYRDVSDYKEGLASATDGAETYFINRGGEAAPGYPRFAGNGVVTLMNGIIQVNIDNRISYYRPNGQLIWQPNHTIPLRYPLKVNEVKYKPNKDYVVYYPVLEGMTNASAEKKVNDTLKTLSKVKPIPADNQLDYSYSGDFNVAWFHKDLLVLELQGYNYPSGAAHGMPTQIYSHINVSNGSMYQLKDLFKPGSDYVQVLSAIIGDQIKNDPQYSYVLPDTYTGIKPNQPFYVTKEALHVYFEPYEIAPYVAGFPTFTIPFEQIKSIIDMNGYFWKSFHS